MESQINLKSIEPNEFKKELGNLVLKLTKDFGKELKTDDFDYLIERLSSLLPKLYGNMRWYELINCFYFASVGIVDIQGVTVKTILDAMKQYKIIQINENKQKIENREEKIYDNFNKQISSKLGEALIFKIEYMPISKWDEHPIKKVVDNLIDYKRQFKEKQNRTIISKIIYSNYE